MNGLTDKEVNESRSKYGSNKIIPDTSQNVISSKIVTKSGVLYVRRKILKKSKRKPIIKPIKINERNILNSVDII